MSDPLDKRQFITALNNSLLRDKIVHYDSANHPNMIRLRLPHQTALLGVENLLVFLVWFNFTYPNSTKQSKMWEAILTRQAHGTWSNDATGAAVNWKAICEMLENKSFQPVDAVVQGRPGMYYILIFTVVVHLPTIVSSHTDSDDVDVLLDAEEAYWLVYGQKVQFRKNGLLVRRVHELSYHIEQVLNNRFTNHQI